MFLIILFTLLSYPFFNACEENFILYNKNLTELSYGYSKNSVCIVEKFANEYFGIIKDIYLGHTTTIFLYKSLKNAENYQVRNCFCHNESSYFVVYNNISKYTTIVRNGLEKSFLFNLNNSIMPYDHIHSKLYLSDFKSLYIFKIEILEKWWFSILSSKGRKDLTKNLSLSMLYEKISHLPENVSDLMIINSSIYMILDNKVYKKVLNGGGLMKFLKISIKPKFMVILYLPLKTIENISAATFSHFTSDLIPHIFNCSSDNLDCIKNKKIWIYILYITDVILILIALYFLNSKLRSNKKYYITPNSESPKFEGVDRPLIRITSESIKGITGNESS